VDPEDGQFDVLDEARRQWVAHGWEEAAAGMAAVTTIVRVHQLLMARIDAVLRPHDLTFARFEVLRLLAFTRSGGLPMGRLGALLQVHPASVTSAVGRLEAQGLVERVPNERDSRSTIARILDAGRARLEPATVDLNELFESIGPAEDLDVLIGALRRVVRRGADVPLGG
jgi:DNA-binding MarR family transcriptional regulator